MLIKSLALQVTMSFKKKIEASQMLSKINIVYTLREKSSSKPGLMVCACNPNYLERLRHQHCTLKVVLDSLVRP